MASTSRSLKSQIGVSFEVFVPDVTPAKNGYLIIDGKRLVVHAARHRTGTRHKLDDSVCFTAKGIKYPHLDVGMTVGHSRPQTSTSKIHIIHQQTYPNPPVSRLEQMIGKQFADEIIVIQKILHIDAAFGVLD